MVTVSDDERDSVEVSADQEDRAQFLAFADPFEVGRHVGVVYGQQRQPRCAKNVFCFMTDDGLS
jgi:hypothetical protein